MMMSEDLLPVIDALVAWVHAGHTGPVPTSMTDVYDAWLTSIGDREGSWPAFLDNCAGGRGGAYLLDSLPKWKEIDPGNYAVALEGRVSEERLDRIYEGEPLTVEEKRWLLDYWIRNAFDDPDQGHLTGYIISEVTASSHQKAYLLIFLTGIYLQYGRIAAAFSSWESAQSWLRERAIVDADYRQDPVEQTNRAWERVRW